MRSATAGLPGLKVSQIGDAVALIGSSLTAVDLAGLTRLELIFALVMLAGSGGLVLGLEDSASRMTRLGKSELVDNELLSIDEVIARVDAVTLDDVRRLAGELFSQPEILAVVGP